MRIKVDRAYTMEHQTEQVKNDIKEFNERYTAKDVLNAIRSQVGFWDGYGQEIMKIDAKAFPGGSYYNDETHFSFEITIDGYTAIYKVSAYMDMDLYIPNIDTCRVRKYEYTA